jgi:hypothetical protein
VAQANLRLAAGVGVMAVCLLVGGPSVAVAIAEPGDGSHSGHSDNGRGSDNSGRGSSRGGSDVSDDNVTNGNRSAQKSATVAAPRTRVGSGRDAGTSEARPGSNYSPDPPSFKPPMVTFGDGRTPGVQNNDEPPRVPHVAPEPAPPPPPPPPVVIAPAPSWVDKINLPPVVAQELRVRQAADLTDPMWGVAGLLLIPATGAVLGYRQARAAQAAAELGRHP